ncbi:hypothetical protein [Pseudoalteromonas luteoviolacea]|uniref:Uncharacterized protein n=1 Tax=Pseudoalteromonas luteoviolacea DSM 6061 TaxID=1365250 RepID=A0A166X9E8_9GAMM|nr:hypothetical protein [Pseudoalteromonas luteoviolacea]KZN39834.1 hypothetical protein N475_13835 [Pseudoalteromonas luteoviolacea DSM 6061]MBE0385773.1 hypothetical protein [Pseudoalteromonas luteoviolacea DSM 6061]
MMASKQNTSFNWFEIFRTGTHTDSSGNTQEFTAADLDTVVKNFSPQKSPLVVGHPKTDDPAWGWASALKVEGDKLFAQAEEVDQDFANAVENKRYPNRSVRLTKGEDGYELAHIGFLGGKAPALDGMKWQFSQEQSGIECVILEFAASERIERMTIDTTKAVVHLVKNLKTFFTDRFGAEHADKVFSEWEAEYLQEQVTLAEHEQRQELAANPEFAAPSNNLEELEVSDKTKNEPTDTEKALQAKLDAANKRNAEHEFNQRKFDAQTFIDTKVNGGNAPRITKTDGLAEFMAHLETGAASTFEFAASDGNQTSSANPAEFFKTLLLSLPEQSGLTKEFSRKDDNDETEIDNSADALAQRAVEYQSAQANKGVTISLSTAMDHVTQESN